jgi:hypothetical protein
MDENANNENNEIKIMYLVCRLTVLGSGYNPQ